MPRLPDWTILVLVLATLVYALRDARPAQRPPFTPQTMAPVPSFPGKSLPGQVMVNVGKPKNSVGTAYSLDEKGLWMTARHVVDGCNQITLRTASGPLAPVRNSIVAPSSDLAVLQTENGREALRLNLETPLQSGQSGYHIGYPKGRPGAAATRFAGKQRLSSRGRYRLEEEVLAWAETSRTKWLRGSLGGMSGGPVLNERGEVIGTVIAENPRRGRLYSTTPASMTRFLQSLGLSPAGGKSGNINADNYGQAARKLRRKQSVAQVVCRVYKQA